MAQSDRDVTYMQYRKTFCLRGKLFWGYCNRYRDRSHSIAEPGP